MFNKDFYPTPKEVIHQMIYGLRLIDKVVLEPSAGSGNIVAALQQSGARVIACETNDKLRAIVSSMCRIISEDFLKVTPDMISHIDYIIMNPPFSSDEKHILHAWEISPPGCQIVALCNSETISNDRFTGRKKLRAIIESNGTFEDLGNCFKDSERNTGVNVSLINLFKQSVASENEFDGFFLEEDDVDSTHEGIQQYNFVRDVVNRYVGAVKIFDQQLETAVKMNELTSSFFDSKIGLSMNIKESIITRNQYKKELQKSAWNFLFKKMDMERFTTSSLQNDINRFVETQANVPFTMRNVYHMFEVIVGTHQSRMNKALLDVFERLTAHYHENRYFVEGWKTNSHYLVNQKFIMPYISERSIVKGTPDVPYNSRSADLIEDLRKALSHLVGLPLDGNHFRAAVRIQNVQWGEWFEWSFFEVKLFKKGTGHFKFIDQNVWFNFNRRIAELKGFALFEKV